MAVKLLSESTSATITDDDKIRIDTVLAFWFREPQLTAPKIDDRMDIWFGEDAIFDEEIAREFSDEVDLASEGKLDHWAHKPMGRLALIILLDQFRRNIYRNKAKAFSHDKAALKLCVEGAIQKKDRGLTPIQRVFFYMPLQHASRKKCRRNPVKFITSSPLLFPTRTKKPLKRLLSSQSSTPTLFNNSAGFRTATQFWAEKTHLRKMNT